MPGELVVHTADAPGGRTVVVAFAGEVDVTNVARFAEALEAAGAGGGTVVADLSDLTYLDSAGIEALFAAARRGPVEVVAGPGCLVRRVVEVVGLAEVAVVREDRPA